MSIETEKKYRLTKEQYTEVLESLKDLGAEFIREDFEVNELYGGGILKKKKPSCGSEKLMKERF